MRRIVWHLLLVLFMLALLTARIFAAGAQPDLSRVQLDVSIEPEEILIGQPAQLILNVEAPIEGIIIWPDISKLKDQKLDILRFGVPDTLQSSEQRIRMQQTHRITAWKEAYIPIEPLGFIYIAAEDTLYFESRAMLLQVKGVEVDMSEMIRDIKPLFQFPYTLREALPYILSLLGLGVILFFLIRYLKKRKKVVATPTIWEKPEVPAHIAAISSLETLRRKQLWQKGQTKHYHSELTQILRMYISKRYGIDAVEMTTSDIMAKLPSHLTSNELNSIVREVMDTADMVKFAKYNPAADVNELVLDKALEFVKNTIPENKEE